jgi:hypothetical protein
LVFKNGVVRKRIRIRIRIGILVFKNGSIRIRMKDKNGLHFFGAYP